MRKTLVLSVLCLFIISSQAFAADHQCVRQGLAEATSTPLEEIVLVEAETESVYVSLGDLAAGDRVTFELRFDGAARFSEELEVIASGGAGWDEAAATPVVELLSANPSRLAALHRLATASVVDVAVSRNGELVKVVPFLELVSESAVLSQGALAPRALRTSVSQLAAPQPVRRYTCEEICDLEQDDCYLHQCGQFGSASCYNACDDQWVECMEGCGICQPSSSSTTTYTLVSITPTYLSQCREHPFYGKGMYDRQKKKLKKTVTTTTIGYDCSETVTTDISYVYQYCWFFLYADPYCFSYGGVLLC